MNSKNKFIVKEILWTSASFIGIVLIFGVIGYVFDGTFSIQEIPWFLLLLVLGDLIGFFYNLFRLKKMDIDIGLAENQTGTLTKNINLELPKEKVLDLLKQNVWKFKTESKEETEKGTLLKLKFYRLIWNEKVEILVSQIENHKTNVKLSAGYKNKSWLMSAHSAWSNSIRHLKYFEYELDKREKLHLKVAAEL